MRQKREISEEDNSFMFFFFISTLNIYFFDLVTGSGCDRFVDVAVVGAGSAGAYFAYRLRDAGLAVELFEYSDRVGGRLFTTTLPNIPDLKLELGGMRYIDGEHHRIQRLVHELSKF